MTAIDGSPTAIEPVRVAANEGPLAIPANQSHLADLRIEHDYDTIVAIGLINFFRESYPAPRLATFSAHTRAPMTARL
jgi:hypothetical protein